MFRQRDEGLGSMKRVGAGVGGLEEEGVEGELGGRVGGSRGRRERKLGSL